LRKHEYKAILTADLHLSNRLTYAQPEAGAGGITDRLRDQLGVLTQIWEYSKKHEADVWILGDLYDRKLIDAITLNYSVWAIDQRVKTQNLFIIPGNHDAVAQGSEHFMVNVFREAGMDGVDVIDKPTIAKPVAYMKLNFVCMPYMSLDANLKAIQEVQKQLPEGDNYMMLHNSILGAKQGDWTCDSGLDPDVISEGFDWVFAGHFHRHQEFNNGCYVGAPMQLNFGEEGNQKCCWLATFTPGNCEMEELEIKAPSFRTFKDLKQTVGWHKGDYVRVVVESTKAEWEKQQAGVKALCEQLKEGGTHAMHVHKPIQQHEARLGQGSSGKFDMKDMMTKYVESTEVATGDLDTNRLKVTGLEMLESASESD